MSERDTIAMTFFWQQLSVCGTKRRGAPLTHARAKWAKKNQQREGSMAVRWTAHIPQAMQRHRGCVAPRPEDVRHEAEICDALHVNAAPQIAADKPASVTESQR